MDTSPQGLEPHHRTPTTSQGVQSAKGRERKGYIMNRWPFFKSFISISGMLPRTVKRKETNAGEDGVENAISMVRVDRSFSMNMTSTLSPN